MHKQIPKWNNLTYLNVNVGYKACYQGDLCEFGQCDFIP
jgi:hypothetical protein